MQLGISTACLYPEQTDTAVRCLAEQGVKTIELFLNTYSETTPAYAGYLKSILEHYGIKVVSLHPFTSSMESMLFFSAYEGRHLDGIEKYKEWYFDFMNRLGIEIFVLHGCLDRIPMEDELYFERYAMLHRAARQDGIVVAQENVAAFKSHSVSFIRDMKDFLRDEVDFVLDIKQTVRAGQDTWQMLETMGEQIIHTHLSDHKDGYDCLPVGSGRFDFARCLKILSGYGGCGSAVVELYRHNFGEYSELFESLNCLSTISDNLCI